MLFKVLVENTSINPALEVEHGFSLYIEANGRKLLFDVGQGNLFLKNAARMGVAVEDVDTLIISHGHYDHGGGLKHFLATNQKAEIYIHGQAFVKHLALEDNNVLEDVGLEPDELDFDRFIFTGDYLNLGDGLELFAGVAGRELCSEANNTLLMKPEEKAVADDFAHEQNLIITENDHLVLISGCAHNGIINILEKFIELKGETPDHILGGFHLSNPTTWQSENPQLIQAVCDRLLKSGAICHTCHCTGLAAFGQMKHQMDDKVTYLAAGRVMEI